MKKRIALLLGALLLTGCGRKTLYQVEPPPLGIPDSYYVDARCTILEGDAIVPKPFESGVYTNEKEWRKAVRECGIKELEEIADRYDGAFFEFNSLACLATCSSGGKVYNFVSAEKVSTESSTELVINASYNPMAMVNSLSGYYFLVQMSKAECSSADSIFLNEYSRLF